MIAIAVGDGRSDASVRASRSIGSWCVVMWALGTDRAVESTSSGQRFKIKRAALSSPTHESRGPARGLQLLRSAVPAKFGSRISTLGKTSSLSRISR